MASQLTFFRDSSKSQMFGGSTKGRRKEKRPVATKRPMHITMRASCAKGALSLLAPRNAKAIASIVATLSHRYRVRVWDWVNNGNHIHFGVQPETRDGFKKFLRRVTCEIALHVTGARKGKPFGKFWDELVWTRIVQWGRAFKFLLSYIQINRLESQGYSRPHARALAATSTQQCLGPPGL